MKVVVPDTVKISGKTYAVTVIAANAFKGSAATSIVIGNNVAKLNAKTFTGASKVKTVTLGKGVKNVAAKIFKPNKKLKTVVVKSAKVPAKMLKKALKGSKVKTVKVNTGKKKVNKKLIKQYKKALKGTGIKVK